MFVQHAWMFTRLDNDAVEYENQEIKTSYPARMNGGALLPVFETY